MVEFHVISCRHWVIHRYELHLYSLFYKFYDKKKNCQFLLSIKFEIVNQNEHSKSADTQVLCEM